MRAKPILTLASLASLSLATLSLATAATPEAAAPKPAAAPAAGAPAAAPADKNKKKIDWEHMDAKARGKYMKSTVLPEMKKLFVAFDAKRYKKMNCTTCHGEKAQDVKFKMPTPELPKLPAPTDRAGFMALQQKKPEAAKFMGTQVKPKMAELLGLAEWTPQTPNGFGCYQCHTQEGTAGGAAPAKDTAEKPGAPSGATAPGATKPAVPPPGGAPKPGGGGW